MSHRRPLVLASALLAATAAAQPTPPDARHGDRAVPVARGHENVVPVDDELMVSDPRHPRLLRSKRPGRIDRKWVERTAMPRIPTAVLDELERVMPPFVGDPVLQSPEAPMLPNAATAVSGRVFIIEGDRLAAQTQNGLGFDHNNGAIQVMQQVLGTFGTEFDFVTVFTTFDDANVAAYYLPLKQDVDGLGECDFRNGKTFGCLFDQFDGQVPNLQGFVFMNSLATWQDWDRNYDGVVHPFTSFDSSVFSTLGQEVAHRWGSGLRFVDPRSNRVSNLLLGRDNSHWAAFVDTDASVMDGWDWSDADPDRFELVGDMDRFSTLDLYTIGALPVAAAKPFYVIDQATFDVRGRDLLGVNGRRIPADAVLQLPSDALLEANGMYLGARGGKVPVTIQDVVDAEGNRCPDPDNTPKTFRQAVVLVTRPGQTVAQAQGIASQLNTVLETWEAWWLDRTNKTMKLCTDLDRDCEHARQELTGGRVEHDGESLQPGGTAKIGLTVKASGDDVEGAVVSLTAVGSGADRVSMPATIEVGKVDKGDEKTVSFELELGRDYPCGAGLIVQATLDADNAASVSQEIFIFPGYRTLFSESFGSADNDFSTNVDGKDTADSRRKGALVYTPKVELTCDMSRRSPERDASIDDDGAFITGPGTDHVPNLLDNDPGEGAELDGDTSLWSPAFDLGGTRDPEIRFAYWLDGAEGDALLVQLSADGEQTFVTAKKITDSFHGWVIGRVSIRDVFGNVPQKVSARFVFDSPSGTLEGGIDEVHLLDFDGQCLSIARGGFCGCSESGDATPTAPVAMLLGLAGLRRLRRRRG
jgi:hypothetical protein